MWDTSQLSLLVSDLGKIPGKVTPAVMDMVDEAGEDLAKGWANNARATAGEHGKHYPDSITAEAKGGLGLISSEVGPESGKRQGGMGKGFEYGSQNQPPHMDGNRAADTEGPKFAKRLESTLTHLLGDLL